MILGFLTFFFFLRNSLQLGAVWTDATELERLSITVSQIQGMGIDYTALSCPYCWILGVNTHVSAKQHYESQLLLATYTFNDKRV